MNNKEKTPSAEEYFFSKSPEQMRNHMDDEIFNAHHMIDFGQKYAELYASHREPLKGMPTDGEIEKYAYSEGMPYEYIRGKEKGAPH